MAAQVRTVAFHGIEVIEVETQVTITSGLPAFTIVYTIRDRHMASQLGFLYACILVCEVLITPTG